MAKIRTTDEEIEKSATTLKAMLDNGGFYTDDRALNTTDKMVLRILQKAGCVIVAGARDAAKNVRWRV